VLSRKYGIREAEIRRYNRLPANRIAAGQWVYVPGAIMAPLEQALFYGTAFASPLPDGVLTSPFGFRRHPVSGRHAFHGGIDLAAPTGTPVLAAHAGEVEFAGTAGGYGKLVVIRHAFGYRTFYGHLSVIQVRPGAKVGSTGVSTGPHLHFEIRHYTRHVDPTRYTSLEHGSRHFRVQ
jgi:murein DD-endopeptidase MepM/ murein hydrolase activator NlpD